MTPLKFVLLFLIEIIVLFITCFWVTGRLRVVLVGRGLLDIPNARSSHSRATPRGGGLGIVLTFLAATCFLWFRGSLPTGVFHGILIGGGTIAVAGFVDDVVSLPFWAKGLIHIAAASWAISCLGRLAPLNLGWVTWEWGRIGQVVSVLGVVWMTNLYNFMDGIDGMAGMEAACASGLGGLVLLCGGLDGLAAGAFALTGASAGFLVWNWQPAKIFMGDVGSGFVGFVFAVLALASAKEHPWLFWPWLILLSVFIVDSTLTLTRRLIAGARWYEAHRSHAYQHAAQRYASHSRVTLTIGAVNIAWLFPLALGACVWKAAAPLFAVVAMAPLVYLALRFGAGQDARPSHLFCLTAVSCSTPAVPRPEHNEHIATKEGSLSPCQDSKFSASSAT